MGPLIKTDTSRFLKSHVLCADADNDGVKSVCGDRDAFSLEVSSRQQCFVLGMQVDANQRCYAGSAL